MSSTEDDMQDVSSQGGTTGGTSSSIIIRGGQASNDKTIPSAADLSYYGHQSPNSLSNQTSWHSEMDHGKFFFLLLYLELKREEISVQFACRHCLDWIRIQ